MKRKISLLIIFILAIQFCFAQTIPLPTLHSGWERIFIKNLGSFDLPPTMEVQKGKYKEFVNEQKKVIGFDATQLTAQQKGLNELDKKGFEKYARVMIETTFGSIGDFEKLNFNINEYTHKDINELNLSFKQHLQKSFLGTKLKLIEWYPLSIEKINGMSCIHFSYKRQLQDNPVVLVHMYIFYNYDRIHKLTLSYRFSEIDYWKNDYSAILKSFRITNNR